MLISLVLPLFNEEKNIHQLINELIFFINSNINYKFDIIFIDNCSTDNSYELLNSLNSFDARVIKNDYNLLYSGSVSKGIFLSRGSLICIIDTDLQFDFNDIPLLIKELNKSNHSAVFGKRNKRKDSFFRIVSSKFFNFLAKIIFRCNLEDLNTGIKILNKKDFKEFKSEYKINMINPEIYAYLINNNLTYSEININHRYRYEGTTSHNFFKTFSLFIDVLKYFFFIKKKIKISKQ